NAEIGEYLVIELVLASEQLVNQRKKSPRLGALHYAMIIRTADAHHFADADERESLGRHRLILRRMVDGTGCHDDALSGHQARIRGRCANRPGIGQADGSALAVCDLKLACAGAFDDVVVGVEELRKGKLVSALDVRNEQGVRPVFSSHIHRNTEVHLWVTA